MRSAHPSAWFQRSNKKSRTPEPDQSHKQPPNPYLSSSSSRPSTAPSLFTSLHLHARNKEDPRPSSATSLRSAYSAASGSHHSTLHTHTHTQDLYSHPFASMVHAPLPVVSSHDSSEEEEECPVCLEPLSFSFRLPGEKPHIVPECGHALHEACFTAVYGPVPGPGRSTAILRKSNLGVCGVCRRPMKVGDGDGGKSNKLAALTGMADRNTPMLFPGRETPTVVGRGANRHAHPRDPTEDDPIEPVASSLKSGSHNDHSAFVVTPSIQVLPEFSSLTRNAEPTQALTCIVVVELPGKRGSGHVPGPVIDPYATHNVPEPATVRRRQPSPGPGSTMSPTDPFHDNQTARDMPYPISLQSQEDSPFVAITEDLRNRIIDWKGHPLSGLGPLQMYDLLSVRRDALVREFYVYLFKEAIICVAEEKKRTLGRFLSSASGAASALTDGASVTSGGPPQSKSVLRLKGRIYIKHIRQVTDTSVQGELSLTIDMEDERLDSFILIFKDRSSLETWRVNVQSLVALVQRPRPEPDRAPLDMEEFGGSAKAARMLSGSTGTSASTAESSLLHSSGRSTLSSYTSHGGSVMNHGYHNGATGKLTPLQEDETPSHYSSGPLYAPHMSAGPSNSLTPLPHPPLDLILVVSLPTVHALPSTAALKLRVIKTSLDFILASLGPRDRLSFVTFEVGVGGAVRKTPFLSPGRTQSRARLGKFIDEIGFRPEEGQTFEDEFVVRGSKEEKTDVVTAVNHGLDVVLQRKSRNPVAGMVLVSDAADSTRRAQMDLVLARAEAANVPIHSFGYGRSHDPASLWLMSNHTGGTYTFVSDWYDLRSCLAGCIGGMLSIGSMNMKLHMKIVDGNRFRVRKVSGGPSSIVSSDGRNVDVELGELRYGERKEMLVELELDNSDAVRNGNSRGAQRAMSATERFNQSLGLDALGIDDVADLTDGMMDRMIDEVPVIEVDGAFYDPAAGKHVSRLAHPVLLTVTLLPAGGSGSPARQPAGRSDTVIVRRRMELLASDMITRALVLVSRKNYPAAQKIMNETKRIVHTVLQQISQSLPPPTSTGGMARNRKEQLTLASVRVLQAILQDMQFLSDALEENVDLFAHDQRNFGAQQAMILRDQKSWTGRSATERVFWTTDNSIELVSRSNDWLARE
ncbi:Pleckstrin homology domain-containing protein [Lactarius vividus]|nr:Pleckstrin homology domain-containing protein [Lactarius vividus]